MLENAEAEEFKDESEFLPSAADIAEKMIAEAALSEGLTDKQATQLALQSLRHLTYKQRRVTELRLGLNTKNPPMEVAEIATSMGISQPHVWKLLRKARAELGPQMNYLENLSESLHSEEIPLREVGENLSGDEFEVLEMIAEGRSWVEAGNEVGIGGLSGATQLRDRLAARLGVKPKQIVELSSELVRIYLETTGKNKK